MSKNTATAFAILFLAINPPLGVSNIQKQSKHNFWSKIMKATVPAKEEKTHPFLQAVPTNTPTGKTQHDLRLPTIIFSSL